MTDRAEIERLLNQTGRTLERLPTQSDYMEYDVFNSRFGGNKRLMVDAGFNLGAPFMFHQSDVIELLVSALRDALDYIEQLEARVVKQNALLAVMGITIPEEESNVPDKNVGMFGGIINAID